MNDSVSGTVAFLVTRNTTPLRQRSRMDRPGMPLRLRRTGTDPQSHERARMENHHTARRHQMSKRRQAKAQALKTHNPHTNPDHLNARERYQHMTQCAQCGTHIDWHHGDPTNNRTCNKCLSK